MNNITDTCPDKVCQMFSFSNKREKPSGTQSKESQVTKRETQYFIPFETWANSKKKGKSLITRVIFYPSYLNFDGEKCSLRLKMLF